MPSLHAPPGAAPGPLAYPTGYGLFGSPSDGASERDPPGEHGSAAASRRAPLRRNITADEVGDACAFLMSDLSRGITGSPLWVDAGYHIMGV